ncbi:alpha/beta hydrolase [Vogesella sp. LIG4]|uniref:alpha/beta hydrolase n=1 Tax=Vogesella sp. LIG4 TaxID=1192162 RepID=UPI0008200DA5|nr:alpha/beta hydrolase [Vogesella sp. LIG4]SCK28583.1 Acetyl esterase/lipase [Vogesella sp. LIG4]
MRRYLLLMCLLAAAPAHAGWLTERLAARLEAQMQEQDAVPWRLRQPGIATQAGLAYGADARQQMDAYWPQAGVQGMPVIVMVHGGAWRTGSRQSAAVVAAKVGRWVPQHMVLVSLDYRLLPQAAPLQQAQDVAAALAWVQQQAPRWGGDGRKVVLMGHSAGAHLVALLTASRPLQQAAGLQPWLGTVALDSAAYDVPALMQRRHFRFYDQAFGADPAGWPAVSPLAQLQQPMPPLLAVCSQQRPDKPCDEASRFVARARQLGGRAELLPVARSHRDINATLGSDDGYTRAVEAFMAGLDPALASRLRP